MYGSLLFQLLVFCCAYVRPVKGSQPYDLIPPLPLDAPLNYDFSGSTVVGRKQVKLTTDAADQRGWIVSNAGGELPENFVFEMEFSIQGTGRNLYGDGMALWFLEEEPKEGSMMGLHEFYRGAAVLIDTYRNGKAGRVFPRLVLTQNDGTKPYDKDHDGALNELDGCGMRGLHNNKRQEYSHIRVSYSRALKSMVVEVNFRHKWEPCAQADIDIGPVKRIAVSAATGELSESVIVKSLQMTDLEHSTPPAVSEVKASGKKKSDRKKKLDLDGDDVGHSFLKSMLVLLRFLFKLFLVLLFIAGAAVLGWIQFKKYQRKREDSRYKLM